MNTGTAAQMEFWEKHGPEQGTVRAVRVRQNRRREHPRKRGKKSRSGQVIRRVIEEMADRRAITWQEILAPGRGSDVVSRARVMAMAICGDLGVPIFHTARAFGRDWTTVFAAEQRCAELYRQTKGFRREWDELLATLKGWEETAL